MKPFILFFMVLLGQGLAFADASPGTNATGPHPAPKAEVTLNNSDPVAMFQEVMENSTLYAMLSVLNASEPDVAKNVEYVALFNEAHAINQTLNRLLTEIKQQNHLLQKNTETGGSMNA